MYISLFLPARHRSVPAGNYGLGSMPKMLNAFTRSPCLEDGIGGLLLY